MSDNPYAPPKTTSKVESNAIPVWVYLICGWPLALVAIGGAIGGALGGAAFGINLAIWKSPMPLPAKIVLNPVVGFTAIGIWLAIAMAINGAMGR